MTLEQSEQQRSMTRRRGRRGGRGGGRGATASSGDDGGRGDGGRGDGGRGGGRGRGAGRGRGRGQRDDSATESTSPAHADADAAGAGDVKKSNRRPGRNNKGGRSSGGRNGQERQAAMNNSQSQSRNGDRGRGRGRGSQSENGPDVAAAAGDARTNNNNRNAKRHNNRNHSDAKEGDRSRNGRRNDDGDGKPSNATRKREERGNRADKRNDNRNDNRQSNNNNSNGNNGKQRNNKARTKKTNYEPHATLPTCLERYASNDPTIIRGKLRIMPSRNGAAFVTCDRGSQRKDVVILDEKDRNRGLDGDFVFVELSPLQEGEDDPDDDEAGDGEEGEGGGEKKFEGKDVTLSDFMTDLTLSDAAGKDESKKAIEIVAEEEEDEAEDNVEDIQYEEEEYLIGEEAKIQEETNIQEEYMECTDKVGEEVEMWQDDEVQMSLWDPVVNLRKRSKKSIANQQAAADSLRSQRSGRVIFILPPKSTGGQQPSELTPEGESHTNNKNNNKGQLLPKRTIVGTLTQMPGYGGGGGGGGRCLLVPNNKSMPRFMCPPGTKLEESSNENNEDGTKNASSSKTLYRAEYTYGSWHATNKWPPCTAVSRLCGTCNVHDETKALLVENGVDHGEFPPAVLKDVEQSVQSGRFFDGGDMGWKPTEAMCRGRRDYRDHRVFTIDPTTAKDLDDALHITPLPDGRVEIGVHIADVSHFIQPSTAVDEEALKRATTVYLVNTVIPMLPRPLCEIACSLNENVERLAFSCVWRMNMDGTLSKKGGGGKGKPAKDDIWYGRTVIKSCSRLDYATAQNIIDKKVANGEEQVDEAYWPKSRQPTGGHTISEVASDVRLMHKVAMARRKLRFDNGALALNGIKLAFQLEEDGETPKLCAPYPIRDSNRLIEEFMLLANYLVAQRLITHAHGRALLRNHSPPIELGMQQVVDVSRESFGFHIDTTDSKTLQESLSRLSRECDDELVVQCVTESLMTPMRPAEYMAAGELNEEEWQHFALNIPYYTHFTSPIRRYPDVIVHRLLQATLDDTVNEYPSSEKEIHASAGHCNDMRMAAKKASERSDRVFLSLYLKENPITSTLGVCLGVGEKTFTVFVPSLGMSTRVFLQEHEDEFNINAFEDEEHGGKRRIVISPKTNVVPGMEENASGEDGGSSSENESWKSLDIRVFTKLEVACTCKMQPPIDVRVKVIGPWTN